MALKRSNRPMERASAGAPWGTRVLSTSKDDPPVALPVQLLKGGSHRRCPHIRLEKIVLTYAPLLITYY